MSKREFSVADVIELCKATLLYGISHHITGDYFCRCCGSSDRKHTVIVHDFDCALNIANRLLTECEE